MGLDVFGNAFVGAPVSAVLRKETIEVEHKRFDPLTGAPAAPFIEQQNSYFIGNEFIGNDDPTKESDSLYNFCKKYGLKEYYSQAQLEYIGVNIADLDGVETEFAVIEDQTIEAAKQHFVKVMESLGITGVQPKLAFVVELSC